MGQLWNGRATHYRQHSYKLHAPEIILEPADLCKDTLGGTLPPSAGKAGNWVQLGV